MYATMALLGKSQAPHWTECRKEMKDPKDLIGKIKDYDRDK